ncbi:MAG: hypothetical protein IT372_36875 [Polyangiaceae bacterium]|nr:hypothetical protein [Polyangiaceae bacterium]
MSDEDKDEDDRRFVRTTVDPSAELGELFDDLEALLKNGDVIAALTARDINASLALLAVDALRAYLAGRKADAVEDFSTVAEEIRARLELGEPGAPDGGRSS